jgi:type I restriction enzyme, R subunit
MGIDKKALSERDICTKYITPAIVRAGWDLERDIREEVPFTDGRVIARGKHHTRGPQKRADYILNYQNIRLAIVEAKKNELSVGHGMQQALAYAEALQVPFVFTSNGDGFLFHDRTRTETPERHLGLEEFPGPEALLRRYQEHLGLTDAQLAIVTEDPYSDGSGKEPRYYQVNAITRTLEAIVRGQQRILLVMATGTGKTLTAFQIIWRLWKSKAKKRILFLADRKNVSRRTMLELPIALPPLPEQGYIVGAVDALMRAIDALEKSVIKRARIASLLVRASTAREAPNAAASPSHS